MSLIRCLLYGFVNYSGKETKSLVIKEQEVCKATYQGPHSHILMTGGGGGDPSDFFGSEILAQSDFLGL